MAEGETSETSLSRRDNLFVVFENAFFSYGPTGRLLIRVTCMVSWLLIALLVQFVALISLNGIFHEYVDPRPEYAESANNVGGWTFVSVPVIVQVFLGWWLRIVVTRPWACCVAACQILLSAYYIL